MPTDAELDALFSGLSTTGTNQAAGALAQTNLPDWRNLPRTAEAVFASPAQAAQEADINALRRPGVPMDTETGAPAGTRFRLAFADDTPSAVKTLQKEYGAQNIAVSPTGQLVIRNLLDEETGQVSDLVVDESKLSAKDLLDLSGVVPEIIGTLMAMRGGRAIPKLGQAKGATGFLRDVATGSVGGQVGGEVAQRLVAESDKTAGEALASRAKGAGADAAFNLLTAGAAKLIPKSIAKATGPLSGHQTQVQTEAVNAIRRIEGLTGIRVPLSIGEETGVPGVMKAEALLEKVPGSTGAIRKEKAIQEQSLRDVQQYMLGRGSLPSEMTVGLDAVDRLKQIAKGADEATAEAKRGLAEVASKEILESFDEMSLAGRQLAKRPVGQTIRARAEAELGGFKAQSRKLYDEVYSTPGANDPIIPTAPLRAVAKEIKESLPKKTKVVEEISAVADAQGRPIVKTTKGKEVLREFVPKQLKRFIDELASGLDPKMPLNEIVQMRTMVNDAVNQADVLPGISTRYLKQVSHALTEALEQGVKEAPDSTLATKLAAANEYYKTNRPRFEKAGIVELFREADNPGYIGDAQIVRRVAAGDVSPDRYADLKEFLGPDSNEFKLFKRAVLDDLYEESRVVGQNFIDAKSFIDAVNRMDREVAQDLLGKKGYDTIRTARLLGQAQGKIDNADLDQLLASGSKSADSFRQLVQKQQQLDSLYANNVIKKFVKGETGAETIKPDEFVARYVDQAKSEADIHQVMGLLNDRPDVVEGIRRKTIEKLFADAARSPAPIDVTRNVMGDPTQVVTGPSLSKALGNEPRQAKLRAVLGDDTMKLLKDLIRVEAALGQKEDVAKTVGGLVGGGILNRLMQFSLKDAAAIAKYKLVAWTLANPRLRGYLTRQMSAPDTDQLARVIIASGPFLQAAGEEFKDESGLAAFFHHLNQSLSGSSPRAQGDAQPQDQQIEALFQNAAPNQR